MEKAIFQKNWSHIARGDLEKVLKRRDRFSINQIISYMEGSQLLWWGAPLISENLTRLWTEVQGSLSDDYGVIIEYWEPNVDPESKYSQSPLAYRVILPYLIIEVTKIQRLMPGAITYGVTEFTFDGLDKFDQFDCFPEPPLIANSLPTVTVTTCDARTTRKARALSRRGWELLFEGEQYD